MTLQQRHFLSLQHKLLLLFIPILTLSLFLSGTLVSRGYRDALSGSERELALRYVNRVSGSIEQYANEIDSLANSIIFNASISELVDNPQEIRFIGLTAQAMFMQKLYGPFWKTSKGISCFHISSPEGINIIAAGTMYKNETVRDQAFLKREKQSEWIRNNGVETFGVMRSTADVISYYRRVINIDSMRTTGVLCFDIPVSIFESMVTGPDWIENVVITIVNDSGQVLYGSVPQQTGDIVDQITIHMESVPLSITGYLPAFTGSGLTKSLDIYRWIVLALCCLFGIAFAVTISEYIFRPLRKLLKHMEHVKQGNLKERISFRYHDEISRLGDTFNEMMDSINSLMNQKIAAEQSKRETEIKLLQTQINPHFLYNTLDAIRWQARRDKSPVTEAQIRALSNIFRQYLQIGNEYILLSDEKNCLKDYLTLMRFRFGHDIRFTFDDTKVSGPCYILKMLLQPLVENALVHGFSEKESDCEIRITCEEKNGRLLISVTDNGCGFSIDDHISTEASDKVMSGKGFALSNIRNRLKMHYGADSCMSIISGKGKGTVITFDLPYIAEIHNRERLNNETANR